MLDLGSLGQPLHRGRRIMPANTGTRIRLGGFVINDVDYKDASSFINSSLRAGTKLAVLFANAHFVAACQSLRHRFEEHPSVHILNDGIGVNLANFLVHRRWFRENMNGTDFVPHFLAERREPLRVYLLGGSPKALAGTVAAFSTFPKITIAGSWDGYSFWSRETELIADINRSGADILLVALGCSKQENWIVEHWRQVQAPVIMGVGGLFDFVSKEKMRAPSWMRRIHLEWLFRLINEPARLGYRYTFEILSFAWIVIQDALPARSGGTLGTSRTRADW
jgi:beta-1,4-glucosyltransferase